MVIEVEEPIYRQGLLWINPGRYEVVREFQPDRFLIDVGLGRDRLLTIIRAAEGTVL